MDKNTDKKEKIHPNVKARVMPHSDEAEQALLGCVLISQEAAANVLFSLAPSDFYSKRNGIIFQAMQNANNRNEPIDYIILTKELDSMGELDGIGGITYITTLTTVVPSADNYGHYLSIVRQNSTLRKLIEAAQRIMDSAYSAEEDALSKAEKEIYSLAEKRDVSSFLHISNAINESVAYMEQIYKDPTSGKGIPIQFKGLNAMLNGFHPSDLVLIAARPGQGKTSIGMNFISHTALNFSRKTPAGKVKPYVCAVFSLEMSSTQLANRLICSVAKVSMGKAMKGQLSADDWIRINDARARLQATYIYVDDNPMNTPAQILSKCRRLKREHGLDMVMVDYLQLMYSEKKTDGRQNEVAEITRSMKIAAKDLDVPILLLSQMSRDIEKRTNKTPQMSDLRESGAIEQDADIIMFLYREHDPNDETVDFDTRTRTDIIVAKHRNGETGKVTVRWNGEYTTFTDIVDGAATKALEQGIPPETGSFTVAADDVEGMTPISGILKETKKEGGGNGGSQLDDIF